ncbi:D-alanyl-D-alanine carboxypeptidase family protein [Desulforudis sp. DRI-14]|uniref:D-alanyl-D-alanine carboxypeptidase family protein n=1 Tax=Desulforudis sp. DRI-14 TaxID=3459793 RepID=UPI004043360F
MGRFLKIYLFVLLAVAIFFGPDKSFAAQGPYLTARAAILIDVESGQVLFGKQETKRIHPASLTKVLTAIVALEEGDVNDVVKVSDRAASHARGSIINLRKGDVLTLDNLLKAAMVVSANDATIAIADHVAGDYDRFIEWMNLKAQLLGACSSRFVNTHGLTHPNHYSTAYDLAQITRYALRNPDFARLASTRETTIMWENSDRQEHVHNTNRLLRGGWYDGCDGIKTGTTSAAGRCLIASATRNGRQLLAVVLHSDNRYADAARLLDYGFSMPSVTVCRRDEEVGTVPVLRGKAAEVPLVSGGDLELLVPENQEKAVKKVLDVPHQLEAPVRAGQRVGKLGLSYNGQYLGSVPLFAGVEVPRKPWYQLMFEQIGAR